MFKYHWRAIIWAIFIIVACLMPSYDIPSPSFIYKIPNFDKFVHWGFYFIFTLVLLSGFSRQYKTYNMRVIFFSFTIAFLCGLSIEIMQNMMHMGRSGDIYDIIANTAGILFGIIFFKPIKWVLRNIL